MTVKENGQTVKAKSRYESAIVATTADPTREMNPPFDNRENAPKNTFDTCDTV